MLLKVSFTLADKYCGFAKRCGKIEKFGQHSGFFEVEMFLSSPHPITNINKKVVNKFSL